MAQATTPRVCSICGEDFIGFGHNPEPIFPYAKRCCDKCNAGVVVPLRIAQINQPIFAAFVLKQWQKESAK